jgi:hypothetical protein
MKPFNKFKKDTADATNPATATVSESADSTATISESSNVTDAVSASADATAIAAAPSLQRNVKDLGGKRDYTFDNYRGFVIFMVFLWCCMFLGHSGYNWTKHTDMYNFDIAFGIMDYGMMMFSLAAGLVINLAYNNRVQKSGSNKGVRGHYASRALAVMGIGGLNLICKNVADNCFDNPYAWEVFMTIGLASLIVSAFLGRKKLTRILGGVALLVFFVVISEFIPFVKTTFYATPYKLNYGGPFAGIGLAGVMLWFSVLGDWYKESKLKFILGTLAVWVLAIPSIVISFKVVNSFGGDLNAVDITQINMGLRVFSVSFRHFTLGFLLFGSAFALLTFMPIWGISALIKREIPFIATMGKNTVVFFFLFAICSIPTIEIYRSMPENLAWLAVIINAIIVVAVSFPIAYLFKRKNIILKA